MVFTIQILIIVVILRSVFNDSDGLKFEKPTTENMILRLLTCYLFHLGNGDVADGYRKLKFLRYNAERFDVNHIVPAFWCSQFQFLSAFLAEGANLVFIIRQAELTDIIINYLVFAGISEIDNIFTNAQRYMLVKTELVDNPQEGESEYVEEQLAFTKERVKTEDSEKSTFMEPIPFKKRGALRLIIVIHEIERVIYKSLYFYLFPYLVVVLSYSLYDDKKA
jgi:hypothetical protein